MGSYFGSRYFGDRYFGGRYYGGATTVVDPNSPPVVADPIANQVATADSSFSFVFDAGTFTDPDGDDLTYTAL